MQNIRQLLVDTGASPHWELATSAENALLRAEIDSDLAKLPFYVFCGVGFRDRHLREQLICTYTNQQDYLVNRNGSIDPVLANAIDEVLKFGTIQAEVSWSNAQPTDWRAIARHGPRK